jgi:hypothetical protein
MQKYWKGNTNIDGILDRCALVQIHQIGTGCVLVEAE